MEDGVSGQLGQHVHYLAEEEVVVNLDLAIIQHQLTEEIFALVLQMKNRKNVAVMNALVIFRCLKEYGNVGLKIFKSKIFIRQFNIWTLLDN